MPEPANTNEASSDWCDDSHVWMDPFRPPAEASLLAHYSKETRELIDSLFARLESFKGITRDVRWQGPAWRWTVTFTHPTTPKDCPAQFAYLIPDPDGLRCVMPLNEKVMSAITLEALPAYLSHPIESAPHPFEWWWPEWVVQSTEHVENLLILAETKHRALCRRRTKSK